MRHFKKDDAVFDIEEIYTKELNSKIKKHPDTALAFKLALK